MCQTVFIFETLENFTTFSSIPYIPHTRLYIIKSYVIKLAVFEIVGRDVIPRDTSREIVQF